MSMITSDKSYMISVILTTYNREKYILRALRSLLAQSYKSFEVIIVDDGSNDKTFEKLKPFLKKQKNFSYIFHPNRGYQYSYNRGLMMAEGKYVTSLDSDDEYSTHHLKNRINYFKKNKRVDLIHSPATIKGKEEDMYVPDARNKNKLIHLNDCVIGATIFGKREAFLKLNGFKNIYGQDFEFIKRAGKILNVKVFDDRTYIYHRNTTDSILTKLKRVRNL